MNNKIPRVRFAPSPTGNLHVGNVRTALINWLFVRKVGGQFILRMDDTDRERSKEEYAVQIQKDMQWLGLSWDEYYRQSDRFDRYDIAKQKLIDSGRLYPAYETQEELDIKRKMQLSRGAPPIYDRAALKLTEEQKRNYEQQGRKPHWRFMMDNSIAEWNDHIRGHLSFKGEHLSDPVLFREDGIPTYTLSSVVDDGELNVTHVIRGEDHVSNTAVQIQLAKELFGWHPEYAHLSLMKSKDGEISKRLGGFDIASLRAAGILPIAIMNLLARIGTSLPIEAITDIKEIAQTFDFSTFSKGAVYYDYSELERINSKIIAGTSYLDIKASLDAVGFNTTQDIWDVAKTNISKLTDIEEFNNICNGEINPVIEDKDFCQKIASLLPEGDWNNDTWNNWIDSIKQATGRTGKNLFMPIRKALTGVEHGAEMAKLLPLIGREKTIKRLTS